jgi:putative Mg2+ transporter-C (MgtC) family protein
VPLHPSWEDIALRLLLTLIAGAVIGADRGIRGHAAGLRTTILVSLAASVAMILTNILLSVEGRSATSFATFDPMRLALGILTGVGFIGGGTILRRGDLAIGVTTAATLWVVTVIGLCFGAGQLALATAATLLSVLAISGLRWVDTRIPRKQKAVLVVEAESTTASIRRLVELVAPLGYRARFYRQSLDAEAHSMRLYFEITWIRPEIAGPPIDLLDHIAANYCVVSFELAAELPQ